MQIVGPSHAIPPHCAHTAAVAVDVDVGTATVVVDAAAVAVLLTTEDVLFATTRVDEGFAEVVVAPTDPGFPVTTLKTAIS